MERQVKQTKRKQKKKQQDTPKSLNGQNHKTDFILPRRYPKYFFFCF